MAILNGQHAIVTGAGSGVGKAIASALVAAGARVTLLGRTLAPLDTVAASCSGNAMAAVADVTDRASLDQAIAVSSERFGSPSIVIANAGVAASAPFERTTDEMLRKMLDINLIGTFNTFQAGLASMDREKSGRLIAIASTAGLKGYAYTSAYCAAKHGVVGLVRSLAIELARTNVTVNAICPGFTDTPMLQRSLDNIVAKTGRSRTEAAASLLKTNPQGRFVAPDDIAATTLWLCSSAASSATGQAISLSGGEI